MDSNFSVGGASHDQARADWTRPGETLGIRDGFSHPPALRPIESQALFGDRGIVQILHEGELYTLRITRNNRLILTK